MAQRTHLPFVTAFKARELIDDALTLEVFVPSRDCDGDEIQDHATWVAILERALCDVAGGCTRTEGVGSWVNPDTGALINENTTVLRSWVSRPALVAGTGRLHQALVQFGRETRQHTVAFVLNGVLYGFSPEKAYE